MHKGSLSQAGRLVALDECWDAITRNVKNWAWSFMSGLRQIGYEFTIRFDTLVPVEIAIDGVMQLLDAQAFQVWDGFALGPALPGMQPCVHTADGLLGLGQIVCAAQASSSSKLKALSARCLRVLLTFRMGCHSLPNVSGRWGRVPRAQCLCLQCAQQVIGDERHSSATTLSCSFFGTDTVGCLVRQS